MNNQAVWQKYSGKVAWPTIILFVGLFLGYIALWYFYENGLSGVWTSCLGAVLAYGMFTIGHEASHSNISGGTKSFLVLEQTLGWISSLFLLFPFSAFRIIHLRHHAHTNDPEKDPDNYVNGKNTFSIFIRCLTLIGHYFGLTLGRDSKKDPAMRSIRNQSIFFTIFLLLKFTFLIAIGEGETLFYVILLSALIAAPILAFSFDWIPHYPHHNVGKYHNTRVITIPGLEFLSLYQSYHLMHHLYPRVPFYKYKSCFLDYENELRDKKSPIEGFRAQDLNLFNKKNTYSDLILGEKWEYILEVENIVQETHNAVKITFKNLDSIPFAYDSGQYVVVSDYVENKLISRCYSICDDPATGKLSIGVKRVKNGKLSNHLLDTIKRGSKIRVSGPYGKFILPKDNGKPLLLIAGGSGITPIISILKTFLRTSNNKVTLLYGCQTFEDVIFKEELDELQNLYSERFDYLLSYEILDKECQYKYLKNLETETLCYVCGPKPMMEASKETFQKIGIPTSHLNFEEFAYEVKELIGKEYEVNAKVHERNVEFSVDVSETILEASIRAKKDLPYACGMGQCGTCKTKLVSGDVVWKNKDEISLLQNELDQRYILPCVCSPKTNITLIT